MAENISGGQSLQALSFEEVKGIANLNEAREMKAEREMAVRADKLGEIQKDLLSKLQSTSKEKFSDDNEHVAMFQEFSDKISEFFPEIQHYQEPGQTASEFSPKAVEIEHKKTVASIQYLLVLSGSDTPIQDTSDPRYLALVPKSFQEKFSPQYLEEQRKTVNMFLSDKEKVYLMSSMLAIHDMAKLGTIAQTIEEIRNANGEPHTTDHDIAFQSLLNDEKQTSELLPSFSALPKNKQELIKSVLKAGSEVNIGQIGQALEGNPGQLEAISRVDLSEDEIGFWFMENLCDTATAAGTPDGSALIMSQENVWKAWKWSVDSLRDVKSGTETSANAYLNLLQNKADELKVDFDRNEDKDITSLRMCMALQTTNTESYKQIRAFLDQGAEHLVNVFGMNGMTGENPYRLYYSPSVLRKVSQIVGLEKALLFMDKIAGKCEEKTTQLDTTQGEITFQLSPIDALINPKLTTEQIEKILDDNLVVDDQLYVRLASA